MVYAEDDESLVEAEVNFLGHFVFLDDSEWELVVIHNFAWNQFFVAGG